MFSISVIYLFFSGIIINFLSEMYWSYQFIIGFYLFLPPLAGCFIGSYLDQRILNKLQAFSLIGLCGGMYVAFTRYSEVLDIITEKTLIDNVTHNYSEVISFYLKISSQILLTNGQIVLAILTIGTIIEFCSGYLVSLISNQTVNRDDFIALIRVPLYCSIIALIVGRIIYGK
jgi:hypothetical protein